MRRGDNARAATARANVGQDVMLTAVSVAVVVVVSWLLFMPPGISMAIDVQAVESAGPLMTLYGRVVDDVGKPVNGAGLVVQRDTDGVQVANLASGPDGTFNVEIDGPAGSYRVVAAAAVGGRNVRDTTRIDMEPGYAYGVSIELQRREYFLFLPLPTY